MIKREERIVNCKICKKDFKTTSSVKKLCNKECQKINMKNNCYNYYYTHHKPKIFNCVVCGNSFPNPGRGHFQVCSSECKKVLTQKRINRRKEKYRKNIIPKNCMYCGKPFIAIGTSLTCGPKCSKPYNQEYILHHRLRVNGKYIKVNKRQKPKKCEYCKKYYKKLLWHHWDDKMPEWGIWVCFQCHNAIEYLAIKVGMKLPGYEELKEYAKLNALTRP